MSEYPVPVVGRRPHRSRAEVARIVASYAQSGLSRSQFCRQHGLSLPTLNKYYQRAGHRDALACTPLPHNAVELPLARVEFVEKPATHTVQHAALQVELVGGRRISVSSGFDAASLTRLIAVLEQA